MPKQLSFTERRKRSIANEILKKMRLSKKDKPKTITNKELVYVSGYVRAMKDYGMLLIDVPVMSLVEDFVQNFRLKYHKDFPQKDNLDI